MKLNKYKTIPNRIVVINETGKLIFGSENNTFDFITDMMYETQWYVRIKNDKVVCYKKIRRKIMNKKVREVNYKALLIGALIGSILSLYLYNINFI